MELTSQDPRLLIVPLYVILFVIIFSLRPLFPKKIEPKIMSSEKFRKNRKYFVIGSIIGSPLGILAYLTFFWKLGNIEVTWFEIILQALAVTAYTSFALIILGVRIYSSIISRKVDEKYKYISEGVLSTFLLIQFILFFSVGIEIFWQVPTK